MVTILAHTAETKRRMLNAAIQQHQTVIDDFSRSIKDMLASQGNINEDEFDLTQQEFNTEMIQRSSQLGDQLAFANEELKLLYNMAPDIGTIHSTVQPGSVVITDREVFFVSVSVERFQLDHLDCFGLSTQSPLYKAMEGKQKGDTFSYNYGQYTILDLF